MKSWCFPHILKLVRFRYLQMVLVGIWFGIGTPIFCNWHHWYVRHKARVSPCVIHSAHGHSGMNGGYRQCCVCIVSIHPCSVPKPNSLRMHWQRVVKWICKWGVDNVNIFENTPILGQSWTISTDSLYSLCAGISYWLQQPRLAFGSNSVNDLLPLNVPGDPIRSSIATIGPNRSLTVKVTCVWILLVKKWPI